MVDVAQNIDVAVDVPDTALVAVADIVLTAAAVVGIELAVSEVEVVVALLKVASPNLEFFCMD